MAGVDGPPLPPTTPPEVASKSRWRPTLEQRVMLENLYNQGIRRPTPEQIQQIVAMLKSFGHSKDIDMKGSSVLYWFQNYQTKLQKEMKKRQDMLNCRRYYFLMHAANSMRNNITSTAASSLLPLFPLEPSGNIRPKTQASSSGHVYGYGYGRHGQVLDSDLDLDLASPFQL